MLSLKPLAAFVKYTVLPLLNNVEKLVNRIEHSNIQTDKIIRTSLFLYVFHTIVWAVTYIIIGSILGLCILKSLA